MTNWPFLPEVEGSPAFIETMALCRFLGCDRNTLFRLVDRGEIPAPLKVGAKNKWVRKSLHDWLEAGCPKVNNFTEGEMVERLAGARKARV